MSLNAKKAGIGGHRDGIDLVTLSRTELQTAQKTMIYWPNPKSPPPTADLDLIPLPPNLEKAVSNTVLIQWGTRWELKEMQPPL